MRWVLANSLAEFLGLGLSAVAGIAFFMVNDALSLGAAVAGAFGVALASGLVEGGIVGSAQWLVLRERLPVLPWRSWTFATVRGAFIAWVLGMVPSTVISVIARAQKASAAALDGGPPDWLQYTLAAAMGLLALGPILGIPQWRVLRRYVPRAGWWVVANGVAWAVGMPIVFVAAGATGPSSSPVTIALSVAIGLLVAGAAVGGIHGAVLVWLLREAN